MRLFRTRDFLGLGRLANLVREERHGNLAYYNVNRYLNPTNLCWVDCALCAWAKKVNEPGGYEMAIEECVEEAGKGYSEAVTEFHIVGGLHPTGPSSTTRGSSRALEGAVPRRAPEGLHDGRDRLDRARREEVDPRDDPRAARRRAWTPAPAAAPRSSRGACATSSARTRSRARSGSRSRASATGTASGPTRRCSTAPSRRSRTASTTSCACATCRTRRAGSPGLIPLAFHPENTPLAHLPDTSGQTDLRVIAVSRLLLDNFPHVKAYWIQIGTKLAQVALFFGADDLVGTVVDETITHAAGATTASGHDPRRSSSGMIRETGREPFERDTEYRRVVRASPGGAGRRHRPRTRHAAARPPLVRARRRGCRRSPPAASTHQYRTKPARRGRRRRSDRPDEGRRRSSRAVDGAEPRRAGPPQRSAGDVGVRSSGSRRRGPRAYPIGLLDRFEVVNDSVPGLSFVVARCALAGVAAVYDRRVGGRILDVRQLRRALARHARPARTARPGTYWTAATGGRSTARSPASG